MGEVIIQDEKHEFYGVFVDERNKEKREEIIDILEVNGYNLDSDESRSKETIIDGFLPIVVDSINKEYRMMGNVTVAACAAQQKLLISKEDFVNRYIN